MKQSELFAKEQVLGCDCGVGGKEQPDEREQLHILHELAGSSNDKVKLGSDYCGAQVLTAPQSPWQNAYAERLIGSIRRECLNHIIVLSARHLKRTLAAYFRYYHRSRPHLALEKQCPIERQIMIDCAIVEIANSAAFTTVMNVSQHEFEAGRNIGERQAFRRDLEKRTTATQSLRTDSCTTENDS